MSQSKMFAKQVIKAKQDIKTRYLAGESVPSIATSYGVSDRNIYYHLGVLSPDDKSFHVKNSSLRYIATKNVQRKEDQEHEEEKKRSAESTSKTTDSSLSDFIE